MIFPEKTAWKTKKHISLLLLLKKFYNKICIFIDTYDHCFITLNDTFIVAPYSDAFFLLRY